MKALTSPVLVPEDFPRDPFPAGLSGSQLKVSAELIDDHYVVGLTDQDRQSRYLYCIDLVEQLIAYAERKRLERSDMPLDQLLVGVDASLRRKDWQLSNLENDWIMRCVRR